MDHRRGTIVDRPKRTILAQRFINFALTVGVVPTPLNTSFQQANISGLYDSMILSLKKAAANPIYWGGANVNVALGNGLEILPGVPIQLAIQNERQLYEIQAPLVDRDCVVAEAIPFIVWDVSNVFLVAVAPTTLAVVLFSAPYL